MADNVENVLKSAHRCFDTIKGSSLFFFCWFPIFFALIDSLDIDCYVLDLAYDHIKNECVVVELNHWAKTTSSSLYDWNKDIELLENATNDIRILMHPIKDVKWIIAGPLRKMAWNDEEIQTKPQQNNNNNNNDTEIDNNEVLECSNRNWRFEKMLKKLCKGVDLNEYSREDLESIYKKLLEVAKRRDPPYFTPSDVSLLFNENKSKRYVRNNDMKIEHCLMSTLYVVLFVRIAQFVRENKDVIVVVRKCEALLSLYKSTKEVETDTHNALTFLAKELQLIKKKK